MCRAPTKADGCPCFFQRGKTVPEELVKPEELSKYRQVASHVVSAGMGKDWKISVWSWELFLNSIWECFAACGINLGFSLT